MKKFRNISLAAMVAVSMFIPTKESQATKWVKTDGPGVQIGLVVYELYRCETRFLSTDGCDEGDYRWVPRLFSE